MTTIKDKKGLIELEYQMAELNEPQEIWKHLLDGLCRVTHSHSSFLQQNDLCVAHQPLLISRGVDKGLIDHYLAHYYAKDIWAEAIASQISPRFHNIQQLVDQKAYLSSELFNDLQKQQKSYYSAGIQLKVRNKIGIMLTFHRDKTQGVFDDEDMTLLNNLVPVLYETLWRISDKFLALQNTRAFAYINSDLKIIEANSAFYEICLACHEISITNDWFSLCNTLRMNEMDDHIRRLFDTKAARKPSKDVEINLYDHHGNIQCSLILKSCYNRVTRFGFCIPGLALRLEVKNYRHLTIRWDRIRERFGLTSAELSVLELVNCSLTRKEIAKRRCCSPETVKSQVGALKSKLDARNQTEIIRKIYSHSSYLEE